MSSPKRRTLCANAVVLFRGSDRAKMNYYQFHIGDYRSATSHLSNDEDLAYRRLLDMYYDTEKPIPLDIEWVARRIRMTPEVVKAVLHDMFEVSSQGWGHARCHAEIEAYKAFSDAGKRGAAKRWLKGCDSPPIATPMQTINQEPITNNHIVDNATDVASPPKVRRNGTRLPDDWTLPKEWADWATQERPDLNAQRVGEQFKDFWISKAGAGATKLNWQATWRNWVRAQNAPRLNPADVVRTTVPSTNERDPTLVRLDEERKNWKPPAPEVMAKMQALKGKVFGANENKETT